MRRVVRDQQPGDEAADDATEAHACAADNHNYFKHCP